MRIYSVNQIAKVLQRKSDGDAQIEYNSKTKHHEVVQTNVLDKDVQEIRTVLNNKAWQENLTNTQTVAKAGKDFRRTFSFTKIIVDIINGNILNSNGVQAYRAAKRNLESQIVPEDYIQSQTTTYTDGKVVEGTFVDGKLKKLTSIAAGTSAPVDSMVLTGRAKTKLNVLLILASKT